MATLVFDIETISEDWETLDDTARADLTRWIRRTARDETEYQARLVDVKEGLSFSPLTGRIVSIGLYDLERGAGVVYYDGGEVADEQVGDTVLKSRTEAVMLGEFFEGARNYDTFVTFNGRRFDAPFLMHRAAINEVVPTVDLLSNRYVNQQGPAHHIDLQDQLTFYGAMQRRPSLHLFCRAYGIESPKVGGVSGADVAKLFEAGQFRDIALYNAGDVRATVTLYRVWQQYFAFGDPLIEY